MFPGMSLNLKKNASSRKSPPILGMLICTTTAGRLATPLIEDVKFMMNLIELASTSNY